MKRLRTPGGVTDDLPGGCYAKEFVKSRLFQVFNAYGYEPVSSPMMEYADVFEAAGAAYQPFIDKDGALLAVKPDMTPPIARIAATAYANDDAPLRFCYWERLFRNAGLYQGKIKEFTQAGIELIGEGGEDADAEAVAVAALSLEALGFANFKVYISDTAVFEGITARLGADEAESALLRALLAAKNFVGFEERVSALTKDRVFRDFLISLPYMAGGTETLAEAERFVSTDYLKSIYGIIARHGAAEHVGFDLSVVGEWDYYTGLVFKGYLGGAGGAVLAGGRYDALLSAFGANRPAVGFGVEIEPVVELVPPSNRAAAKTLFSCGSAEAGQAAAVARELRKSGSAVIRAPRGLSEESAVDMAKRRGCAGVILLRGEKAVSIDIAAGTRGEINIGGIGGGI
jgi:ATP phosphoribosyltransferase regulatory subunit